MGLDMYLYANRYIGGWDHNKDQKEREDYERVLALLGLPNDVCRDSPGSTVQATIGYWRKANAIHQWFVDNVQDGEDECREHDVSREQLIELRDLCRRLLELKDKDEKKALAEAQEYLPPQAGFFFGSTEVDDYYWGDLAHTVAVIDRALALDPDGSKGLSFCYCSSW
jgi:hypothetical protein